MKIEKQFLDDHQAKLVVEVESDQMDAMKRRAARKIARRVKIPGFRPGKAPYAVIVRQIGEGAILEEAMEMLVNDIYPKVIDESGIDPYGPGSLENVSSMDPPILEFVVPLEAEVTLGDYRSIRKPYEPEIVADDDVQEVLENLRERQAVIEPVERPAELGDLVTVRISAERTQSIEGEDPTLIEERSTQIVISDLSDEHEDDDSTITPDEWPYLGFSQQLTGLEAGDEKTLQYTYPEDAEAESYRGVDAKFQIYIESVKARNLPDIDDDFAKTLGDYDDLEALKSEIRTALEDQTERTYNEDYDEEILNDVIEQSEIKYPPQMLEREIDRAIGNLEDRLRQQGLDLDLYLKTRSIDMDELREEILPTAETRLKQSLVLLELAKAEDLQIDPNQVQAEAQSTLNYFEQTLPRKEARKLSTRDVYTNLVSNIMADMLIRNSMERLRDICRGQTAEDVVTEQLEEDIAVSESEITRESKVSDSTDETEVDREESDLPNTEFDGDNEALDALELEDASPVADTSDIQEKSEDD